MNWNKKLMSLIVAGVMTVVIGATGYQQVQASRLAVLEPTNNLLQNTIENKENLNTSPELNLNQNITKEETVYAFLNADGSLKQSTVSVWLKNADHASEVSDVSNLLNIKNVKGYETFSQENNNITWDANGNDIYYQGQSEVELPVQVKVTYKLNGEEVSQGDLIGKSGKLTIRFDYVNTDVQEMKIGDKMEKIYTPYLMVTGCILPTEVFHDVEVTNGKLVSDGNQQIVVGMGLPGVASSLQMDEDIISIPDYFEITADVSDFHMSSSLTVAMNDILSELGFDDVKDMDDIKEKLDELSDGALQIMNGSQDLKDGLVTLDEKMVEFSKGLSTLKEGLTSYCNGTTTLANGASELTQGAKDLSNGASQLNDGLIAAKEGMGQIVNNYEALQIGVTNVSGGINALGAGLDELANGLSSSNQALDMMSGTTENSEQIIQMLKQYNVVHEDATLSAIIDKMEQNLSAQKMIVEGMKQGGSKLASGVEQLQAGSDSLTEGMTAVLGGVTKLSEGSNGVYNALGTLSTGAKSLNDGVLRLYNGSKTLSEGASQLVKASPSLLEGSNQLLEGTTQLKAGTKKLSEGATTLSEGTATFYNDGAKKLSEFVKDDFTIVMDRLHAMIDCSQEYKSYSDCLDGMQGSVKYILKTDAVE